MTTMQSILVANNEAKAEAHAAELEKHAGELELVPGFMAGDTPLLLAARYNASHLAGALAARNPESARLCSVRGETVLHVAAAANACDVIEALKPFCSSGVVDINARDWRGRTAIVLAAEHDHHRAASALSGHAYCIREGTGYAHSGSLGHEEWRLLLETLRKPADRRDEQPLVLVSVPADQHLGDAIAAGAAMQRALRKEQCAEQTLRVQIVCPSLVAAEMSIGSLPGVCSEMAATCCGLVPHMRASRPHYAVLYIGERQMEAHDAGQLSACLHPVLHSRLPCLIAIDARGQQQAQRARRMLQSWATERDPLAGPFFGFSCEHDALQALARAVDGNDAPTCSALEMALQRAGGPSVFCVATHPCARVDDVDARTSVSWVGVGLRVIREGADGRTVTLASGPLLALPTGVFECHRYSRRVATLLVTQRQLGRLQLEDGSCVESPVCSTATVLWREPGLHTLAGCTTALTVLAGEQLLESTPVYFDGADVRLPQLMEQLMWHVQAPQFVRLAHQRPALDGRSIVVCRGQGGLLEARCGSEVLLRCGNTHKVADAQLVHNIASVVRYRTLLQNMQRTAAAGAEWIRTCFVVVDWTNMRSLDDSESWFTPHESLARGTAAAGAQKPSPAPLGRTLSTMAQPDVFAHSDVATLWNRDLLYIVATNTTCEDLYAQLLWFGQCGSIQHMWPPHNSPGLLPPSAAVRVCKAWNGKHQPWQIGTSDNYANIPFTHTEPDYMIEYICLAVARHPFSLAHAEQPSFETMDGYVSRGDSNADVQETKAGHGQVQVRVFKLRVHKERLDGLYQRKQKK